MNLPTPANVAELAARLGADWPAIRAAGLKAERDRAELEPIVSQFLSEDLSFVVFGSIARGESTGGSDLDWALLVDGQTKPTHLDSMLEIRDRIPERFKPPGVEHVFGDLMFSHDLVHFIGGDDDDNANLTRRLLLLLESLPLGRDDAYTRTIRAILTRYVNEDLERQRTLGPDWIPRFLQNDISRYWRTMAVDFAYKRRTRGGQGWALRNAKLRMSRKLLHASGLAMCFSCALDTALTQSRGSTKPSDLATRVVEYLSAFVGVPPLAVMAHFLLRFPTLDESARLLFSSYDRFLAILDDAGKRDHLKMMTGAPAANDQIYGEVRQVSDGFQDALTAIFMGTERRLTDLTVRYGVF